MRPLKDIRSHTRLLCSNRKSQGSQQCTTLKRCIYSPVLTDAGLWEHFVCRGTLVGYKHCNTDTTRRRTLAPKRTNVSTHTRERHTLSANTREHSSGTYNSYFIKWLNGGSSCPAERGPHPTHMVSL